MGNTTSALQDQQSCSPSSVGLSPCILSDDSWSLVGSSSPSTNGSSSPPPAEITEINNPINHIFLVSIWHRIPQVAFAFRVDYTRRLYPVIEPGVAPSPLFNAFLTNTQYTRADEAFDRTNGTNYLFTSDPFPSVVNGETIPQPPIYWSLKYHATGANILCLADNNNLPLTALPRYAYIRGTSPPIVASLGVDFGSLLSWCSQNCQRNGRNIMEVLPNRVRGSRVVDHFTNCRHCARTTLGRLAKVTFLPFTGTQRRVAYTTANIRVLMAQLRASVVGNRDGCVYFSHNFAF